MLNKQFSVFILVAVILSGCSANYHLKRAKRHELIAISKGALIKPDTVYIKVPVFVKETALDSIFVTLPGDTVVLTKDRLHVKFIDLPGDSVFIQGKCDSMVIYKEVPVTVTQIVSAPDKGLKWWMFILIGFIAAFILCLWLRLLRGWFL